MQERVFYGLSENHQFSSLPEAELNQLVSAYDILKRNTRAKITEEHANFDDVFLVAEKAFLLREVHEFTLEHIRTSKKSSTANYTSISKFGNEVVNKLLTKELKSILQKAQSTIENHPEKSVKTK